MIHILYVPKDKEPLDFYEIAKQNNCRQIVHGPSDMINDHLPNENEVTVISIPEYVYIDISERVVEEGQTVTFKVINEFISEMKKDSPVFLEVYKRYEKSDALCKKEMQYDNFFSYDSEYKFDEYGEYLVRVTGTNKKDETVRVCEEEVIVFKPVQGKEEGVFSFDD